MALTSVTFNIIAYLRSLLDLNLVQMAGTGDPNTAGPITAEFPNGSPIGIGQAGTGSTFVDLSTGDTYVNVGTINSPVWQLQGMALQPTTTLWYGYRAGSIPTGSPGAGGILQPFGVGNAAVAGAADGDNDQTDGTYIRFTTAASGGSAAGAQTNRDGPQTRHNPKLFMQMRTGADVTSIRFWFGLSTNLLANVDDIGGSSEYAMIRYSTVAADPGFMAVTRNGTTQTVHGKIADVLSNTPYLMKIEKLAGNNWQFDINGSKRIVSSEIPGPTAKFHSFVSQIFTQVASARSYLVSSVYGQYGA